MWVNWEWRAAAFCWAAADARLVLCCASISGAARYFMMMMFSHHFLPATRPTPRQQQQQASAGQVHAAPDPWMPMGMLMIELSRMYYSSPLPNCCEMSTEYADVRSPDFQAVIVVDYDNRLFPLTETIPTCLLPVANRKLLAYQLDMLAKSGVAG